MPDFLEKIEKESFTSRYQQQLIPVEEGKEARTPGKSVGQVVPDSLIVYNSAGGDVNEKDIKPQLEAGKYGKVRVVTETHAGHVILVDETAGNERIYILHPNGTYTNIEPELMTIKVETDQKTFVNGVKDSEVSKDHNEHIHKNHNVHIYLDENENIDKNKTDKVGGYEKRKIGQYEQEQVGAYWKKNIGGTTDIISGGVMHLQAPIIFLN